ncbi:hypothetical protein F4553_004161 [Allocatelliglobosispora scoriae]|uniref:Uncharacterized protein n=1 Tax=Allocatelliglobosispora scoriae TaxID=643052 RepID=A0A841BVJ2_9ACTN|nr:N-formylglutamate amidohydrolase [Allocatelliglobosispora scoriae]MBB5870782.1 hypothetical protein [Allocatelliglobosispora scoriae]
MESPTLTVGHNDQAIQLDFLDHQRRHACTDCGHAFLNAETPAEGFDYHRQVIGGGTIIANTLGPIREVHILPHCGTELPDELLREIDPADRPALAQLVHDNADIGTGAIYRHLAESILAGRGEGVAVAGFHLSRLLLDANRIEVVYQVPASPYVGTSELYADFMQRRGTELREDLLLPWLDAVNRLLRQMGESGVAYHHHTLDVYSMTPRPWDQASHEKRPAFQLVWERPTLDATSEPAPGVVDPGLAPIEDLRGVRDRITEYLEAKVGLEDAAGEIDFPLLLPVVPFAGALRGDLADLPPHIMYDVRKDILATDDLIRSWVGDGPWRLPAVARSIENDVFAFDGAVI